MYEYVIHHALDIYIYISCAREMRWLMYSGRSLIIAVVGGRPHMPVRNIDSRLTFKLHDKCMH